MTTTRTPSGRFVKGVSGNPNGRPTKIKIINHDGEAVQLHELKAFDQNGNEIEVSELYRINSGPVFARLFQIIMNPKTPPAALVAAIKEYNNRAFGSPPKGDFARQTEDEEDVDVSLLPIEVRAQIIDFQKGRVASEK